MGGVLKGFLWKFGANLGVICNRILLFFWSDFWRILKLFWGDLQADFSAHVGKVSGGPRGAAGLKGTLYHRTLAQSVFKSVWVGGAGPPIRNPFQFYQSGRGKSSPENWAIFGGFEANLGGICYRILVDLKRIWGEFVTEFWRIFEANLGQMFKRISVDFWLPRTLTVYADYLGQEFWLIFGANFRTVYADYLGHCLRRLLRTLFTQTT